MARGTAGKRDRVLSDEELRAFWRASVGWQHPFSLMLRYVLLTAARRDEAAEMQWSELTRFEAPEGHLWMIPAGRYKTKVDFDLPLSGAAWAVLIATPLLSELRKAATERGEDPDAVLIALVAAAKHERRGRAMRDMCASGRGNCCDMSTHLSDRRQLWRPSRAGGAITCAPALLTGSAGRGKRKAGWALGWSRASRDLVNMPHNAATYFMIGDRHPPPRAGNLTHGHVASVAG
jgi:integrase